MGSSLFEPDRRSAEETRAPKIFPPLEVKKEAEANSLQELGTAMARAVKARSVMASLTEEQVDAIFKAVCRAVNKSWLLRVRMDDGGMGRAVPADSSAIAERHCHTYTGRGDKAAATPLSVGFVSAANPTLAAVCKALDAIRDREPLILSPYPALAPLVAEAASIIHHAAVGAGAPEGFLCCAALNGTDGADLPKALLCSSRIFMQSAPEARCKPEERHGGTAGQPISLLVLRPAR